jgi:hypothetical protein
MESYGILPPNCAFRKVVQLEAITPQEFFAAVRLFTNWSICVIWWKAVREHPPLRTLYSPENADPFRQRAVDGGRGPGRRFGGFRYAAESVQSAHLSSWCQDSVHDSRVSCEGHCSELLFVHKSQQRRTKGRRGPYMVLILMYRLKSESEATNTYPPMTKPAAPRSKAPVPATFVNLSSAFFTPQPPTRQSFGCYRSG